MAFSEYLNFSLVYSKFSYAQWHISQVFVLIDSISCLKRPPEGSQSQTQGLLMQMFYFDNFFFKSYSSDILRRLQIFELNK